jgi:hypothetical protein
MRGIGKKNKEVRIQNLDEEKGGAKNVNHT